MVRGRDRDGSMKCYNKGRKSANLRRSFFRARPFFVFFFVLLPHFSWLRPCESEKGPAPTTGVMFCLFFFSK